MEPNIICQGQNCIEAGRQIAVGFWLWDLQKGAIGLLIAVALLALVGLVYGAVCLTDFIQFKIACRRWKRENR